MAHSAEALNRAARNHIQCRACGAPAGRRCLDQGARTDTAHPERLADAELWFLGYDMSAASVNRLEAAAADLDQKLIDLGGERDNLEREIQSLKAQLTEAQTRFDDLQTESVNTVHQLELQVADLTDQRNRAVRDVAALQDRLDEALARIEELTKPAPTPTPTPTPSGRTLFGSGGGQKDRRGGPDKIDRRYYNDGTTSENTTAVAEIKRNADAGLLTWASFKLPVSWQSAVNGGADAWFDDLMRKLAAFGGLVWIAIHHEPEGDGDPALWKALQDRLSRRVPGGIAGNIKFWLVVTGYGQEHNVAGKTWDDLYPTGAPIYGIGYDNPYLDYGFTWSGGKKTTTMNTGWQEASVYIGQLAARARKLGVKAAIGEFGFSDEAFAKDKGWLQRAYESAKASGLLAVCYFDTPLNSKRSWTLGAADSAKRAWYNQLTKQFNS